MSIQDSTDQNSADPGRPAPPVTVVESPERSRFDILVDGVGAGYSMYEDVDAPGPASSEPGEPDEQSAADEQNTADGRASADGQDTADEQRIRQRIFFHTIVHEEFSGRGLASTLTREALAATVAAGLRIVPVCPYVVRWLSTHHEFDASVDLPQQEHLDILRG
ncbi:GNAT family N-acetyltransferase [Brachybacterium sp. DNPG3]